MPLQSQLDRMGLSATATKPRTSAARVQCEPATHLALVGLGLSVSSFSLLRMSCGSMEQGLLLAPPCALHDARHVSQARRRGAQRLGFHNTNLGTWEQFELVDSAAVDPPWSRTPVALRSRRLPQVLCTQQLLSSCFADGRSSRSAASWQEHTTTCRMCRAALVCCHVVRPLGTFASNAWEVRCLRKHGVLVASVAAQMESICRRAQFIMAADMVRVGSMAQMPNSFVTPRSLPANGDPSDARELEKLSGVLVDVRLGP